MAFVITGTTRDDTGTPLPACDVYLLKYDSGGDSFTQIDSGVSDGSGDFLLTASDDDPAYVVIAFEEGSPVVAGVTRRDLTPSSDSAGQPIGLLLSLTKAA